jgi:hypothetical protein
MRRRGKERQLPYNIRSSMKLGHENMFHSKEVKFLQEWSGSLG